ncbi:MAG: VPS10 domain-containing protein [Gemmatimonadaceae bacterium]|nr:hypothetical protein [Gemmatimonadota bacterium]
MNLLTRTISWPRLLLAGGTAALFIADDASSQGRAARAASGAPAAAAPIAPAMLQGLRWRGIGPATMSGRIADVAVARTAGAPDVLYVAASIGGVWKTADWGASWDPVFDNSTGASSVGDVTVAPSNPNIVWVGTGEPNNRQSSSWGDGVYKSMDAGKTWAFMGLKETRHVGRIIIHPTNPDIVYVAALGHLWGSNAERGVFRTRNGGRTWEKVLYVDEHTGVVDLVIDPQDPQMLIAAAYQRQRKAWGFNGGGLGSGLYRTLDGGESWTRLKTGLPSGDLGRIGLDIFRRDGRLIYATVEADPAGAGNDMSGASAGGRGGIFRSRDRGDSWEQVNTVTSRPMYFSLIRIDPTDPQRIYFGGTSIMTSHDGGRTFFDPGYGGQGVHPDQHAMWIDPDDPNFLVLGNDGGIFLSHTRGATWRFIDNLPLGQFYEVDADMRDPYHVCGGLQDNGDWCTPSAVPDQKGLSRRDAYLVGGGDGYYVRIDSSDPGTVYVEQGGASIKRFNYQTGETQEIQPTNEQKGERPLRGNWNAPMAISHFDPKTIYVGMNKLFRSRDRGVTWSAISADVTAAIDRDTLTMMGARVGPAALSRHDGVSAFSTLTTIGESPLDRNVLYVGADDGVVQVTTDGGAKWTDISRRFPGLPPQSYVSRLTPSRHVAGRVYATFDGHRSDDYAPHVYVSEDFGQSWRAIERGLPETSVYAIVEHPRVPTLLFVGHERGVHLSMNGGADWQSLNTNLPTVPVYSLMVHPRDNDLIAATFGRAIWILDDLGPLEALASQPRLAADAALASRPGRQFNTHHYNGWFWPGHFEAPNPEYGVGVSYWLTAPAARVEVDITGPQGETIKTIPGSTAAGINRVYWDLRGVPTEPFDSTAVYNPVFRPPPAGPPVKPGRYQARVRIADRAPLTIPLTVNGDPRTRIADADRDARQDAIDRLYGMKKSGLSMQEAIRGVTTKLAATRARLAPGLEAGARLTALADSLAAVDRAVARSLRTANSLLDAVGGFTGRPTAGQSRSMTWAYDDLASAMTTFNALLQSLRALGNSLPPQDAWLGGTTLVPLPPPGAR